MELWFELLLIMLAIAVGGALAPVLRSFLEKLIGYRFDRALEEYRFELQRREQATKIAEYVALTFRLSDEMPEEELERANRLALELLLILPSEIYEKIPERFVAGGNPYDVPVAIREMLQPNDPIDSEKLFLHFRSDVVATARARSAEIKNA